MLASRATLAIAFLARESFAGASCRPGAISVPRASGGRSPILGIDPGRAEHYDISVGGRVNLWRDTVFGIVERHLTGERPGHSREYRAAGRIEVAF